MDDKSSEKQARFDDLAQYYIQASHRGGERERDSERTPLPWVKRSRYRVPVLLALIALAALVAVGIRLTIRPPESHVATQDIRSTLIVRGEGLGSIKIGMTEPEVVRILGRPSEINDLGFVLWNLYWANPSIRVLFLDKTRQGRTGRNGAVWMISTDSPSFRTKEGIGVGSSVEEVIRLLGTPPDHRKQTGNEGYLAWWDLKLGYENSTVVYVSVSEIPPGEK